MKKKRLKKELKQAYDMIYDDEFSCYLFPVIHLLTAIRAYLLYLIEHKCIIQLYIRYNIGSCVCACAWTFNLYASIATY